MKDLIDLLGMPSVNLVIGKRRSGKTAFAYRVLEKAHERDIRCSVLYLPKDKKRYLPNWIETIDEVKDYRDLPEHTAILGDEMYMRAHARDSPNYFNKMVCKLMGVASQRDQLLLFLTHLTRKLDVGVVYDSDNIVFRQPSFLHLKFERQEIIPLIVEAGKFLKKVSNPLEYAYIVSEKGAFKIKVGLPSFWNDKLSKPYAK
jgi:hypothetical protein